MQWKLSSLYLFLRIKENETGVISAPSLILQRKRRSSVEIELRGELKLTFK